MNVAMRALKTKILGVEHYVSQLTNPIQFREYSRDGDNGGTLHRAWAVNANWNPNYGDWNVNVHSVANLNEWNAGNQVLSKLFSFKNPLLGFCLSPPAAKHSTNLLQGF